MFVRTTTALALSLTLALAACGDDEDAAPVAAGTPAATANVEDYCALTKRMDTAGGEFFAALEADDSATDADYETAEREFLERYAGEFAEIVEVAPPEIAADVEVLLQAQRERSGLESTQTPQAEVTQAEKRVRTFEKRAC